MPTTYLSRRKTGMYAVVLLKNLSAKKARQLSTIATEIIMCVHFLHFQVAIILMATAVLGEPSKVIQKRSGLVGHYAAAAPVIAHGYSLGGYGLGGYGLGGYGSGLGVGLGSGVGAALAAGPGLAVGSGIGALSGARIVGADVHTTVTKHVGVPVPAPYPVAVDRPYPVAVRVRFEIQ